MSLKHNFGILFVKCNPFLYNFLPMPKSQVPVELQTSLDPNRKYSVEIREERGSGIPPFMKIARPNSELALNKIIPKLKLRADKLFYEYLNKYDWQTNLCYYTVPEDSSAKKKYLRRRKELIDHQLVKVYEARWKTNEETIIINPQVVIPNIEHYEKAMYMWKQGKK